MVPASSSPSRSAAVAVGTVAICAVDVAMAIPFDPCEKYASVSPGTATLALVLLLTVTLIAYVVPKPSANDAWHVPGVVPPVM